jgi:alanine dehydrogenase
MKIGTVKEIKNNEYRVGLTPDAVSEYIHNGHIVYVETTAGEGSSFLDSDYLRAGAIILKTAAEVWENVDMLVKVKEPLEEEYKYLRKDLILYTYLHLAADKHLTDALLKSGTTGIAYETIQESDNSLPCLKPMSQVAGRLAVLEGAKYLQKPYGGNGLLINGVPGTPRAKVLVLGAGVVGENAIQTAIGLGANVTVLDINLQKLEKLDELYKNQITTLYSSRTNLINELSVSDLIISAVLLPGAKAPKMIKQEYYKLMKKGSVIVDVAIDQGGTTEVSRPTTHTSPVFVHEGITHYCVANMPGAVALTSTIALNNATLRYGLLIANKGLKEALELSKPLLLGLNTYKGKVTCEGVSKAFNLELSKVNF